MVQTGARPIETHPVPEGTPNWGGAFKKAVAANYLKSMSIATHGAVMSHRGNYLDLDPTYRDVYGRPLLRMTFDFTDNEHQHVGLPDRPRRRHRPRDEAARDQRQQAQGQLGRRALPDHAQHRRRDHGQRSADERGQHATCSSWDVPNLFVMGASAFPQNPGYNPTGTVAALAYASAAAITQRYLKAPGALA